MPLMMDISTALYVSIGLIVCAFVLIAVALFRRPTGSGPSRCVEWHVAHASAGRALEGHLRSAILDPGARERLVDAAMQSSGGDRAAAIREVLYDLERDNR